MLEEPKRTKRYPRGARLAPLRRSQPRPLLELHTAAPAGDTANTSRAGTQHVAVSRPARVGCWPLWLEPAACAARRQERPVHKQARDVAA